MKKNIIKAFLALTTVSLLGNSVFAKSYKPTEIIENVIKNQNKSFKGRKLQRVVRRDIKLNATADVVYINKDNHKVSIVEPSSISGIKYFTKFGKSAIQLSAEKLAFTNSIPAGGRMIADTIMSKITNNLPLLKSNYNIKSKADDQIAGKEAFVLELTPKNNRFDSPGKVFWISKDDFQILREDRYWNMNSNPFFTSQYIEYEKLDNPSNYEAHEKLDKGVNKIDLGDSSEESETFLVSFDNKNDLVDSLKVNVEMPSYIPKGYQLEDIQVLNLYDTKLFIEKYSDGLNAFFVTYRTKPNFFLTLLAGNFSLSLLHKMGDLSYHAPYNYFTRESEEHLVVVFGDLYPNNLKKVSKSVKVK